MNLLKLFLLITLIPLLGSACGVKKPPTPIYTMAPFAETPVPPSPSPKK